MDTASKIMSVLLQLWLENRAIINGWYRLDDGFQVMPRAGWELNVPADSDVSSNQFREQQ